MAVYNNGAFTGAGMDEVAGYLNRMNEELRYVLSHLDDDNMTGDYSQATQSSQEAARSAAEQVRQAQNSARTAVDTLARVQAQAEQLTQKTEQMVTLLETTKVPVGRMASWNGTRYTIPPITDMVAGQLLTLNVDVASTGSDVRVYPINGQEELVLNANGQGISLLWQGWHLLLFNGSGGGLTLIV